MANEIITIEIDPKGNFSLDLEGFQGKGCQDVAKLFESMGTVTKEEIKPAAYAGPGAGNYISSGR